MDLHSLPIIRQRLFRVFVVVCCALAGTAPAQAELLPGETKADTVYNEQANELNMCIHHYNAMAQRMNDAPKVRLEVESIIQSAANTLKDAAQRRSLAADLYRKSAQTAYEEQVVLLQDLQNKLKEYKAQTPPDEAGIAMVQQQIEKARQDYDARLARLIGEYEEEIYGAGNGIASMASVMNGVENDLQAAAALERMLQTALDTYVAEWLGLTPDQQTSPQGVAYRRALDAAQAVADAPYDSPETYQDAIDSLEQASKDMQDFVTAIDSPVTTEADVCVRTLNGRTLFRHIAPEEALRRLPRGLYLFNERKVYVR